MATLGTLTNRVMVLIGQNQSAVATAYAKPRIKQALQHRFNELFDLEWWPQFLSRGTYTLDGTTGKVVGDLSLLFTSYEDIDNIYPDGYSEPLRELPREFNYDLIEDSTSTIPQYRVYDSATTPFFRVVPATATGDLHIVGRLRPQDFVDENDSFNINFDTDALVLGAAYDIIEEDGSNPGAAQKFQIQYERRVQSLRMKLNNKSVALDPRIVTHPSEWYYSSW